MSYNKFRWWSRGRKVKPLPETTPLLLKILNGDYEYSYMFADAKHHRKEAEIAYEKAYQNYVGNTEAGRIEAAMNVGRMKRVKAVKAEIEAGMDEIRILDKLKRDLEKEFSNDYWNELMYGTEFDGNVLDLYFRYKERSGMDQTPSEFDIKYKRDNCSKYLYLLERLKHGRQIA
jgi:hypothetical protein